MVNWMDKQVMSVWPYNDCKLTVNSNVKSFVFQLLPSVEEVDTLLVVNNHLDKHNISWNFASKEKQSVLYWV